MTDLGSRQGRIAILYHARQPRSYQDDTMITWIARRWEESGYHVSHLYGPNEAVEADVLIIHVNVSVVPDDYLRFAERFPAAVNAAFTDIRKRRISTNLVTRDDDYQGPVVIKTDLNFGGLIETEVDDRLKLPPLSFMQRVRRKLKIKDPSAIRSPDDYLIYDTKNTVPAKTFDDPNLVIERFLPERHGDEYYHRRYVFFGDAECNVTWAGRVPINSCDNDGHRNWTEPVRPELREFRMQLGADYGKIDYVIVDGEVEVFDVNRTPGGSPYDEDPVYAQWVRETTDQLAKGITTWLPA